VKQQTLFRKAALERLSSPEQLDLLMEVTSSRAWLALLALGLLLAAGVLWSFFGVLPTRVSGQGILIRSGGVYDVVSVGSGRLTEINVAVGDNLKKDQLIARIAQPDLMDQIQRAKAELNEMNIQHQALSGFLTKDTQFQSEVLLGQRRAYEQKIADFHSNMEWYKKRIAAEEKLVSDGVITEKQLLTTREEFRSKEAEMRGAQNQLREIAARELALRNQNQQQSTTSELKIADQKRKIHLLENQLDLASRVTTPYEGRVLEVKVDQGDVVSVGTSIVSLELQVGNLQALIYIPAAEGKKVQIGMEAQITPSTVRAEEYGLILAKVKSVSDFPATSQGMMRMLGNDSLVQSLSASGAPVEVYVDLIGDPKTDSGYRWSSGMGPPLKIYSGTLCGGMVTVQKQRPINLLIPYLRETLGI
jgi:HlyD family secretion protein